MIFNKPINIKHIMSDGDYKIIGYVINKTESKDSIMILYQEWTTNGSIHYVRELENFREKFNCPNLDEILNDK